jgi:hypothetical protein
MNERNLIREIRATYQRHGWELRRLLLLPATRSRLVDIDEAMFAGVRIDDADVDALWFSRPSPGNREAWELRLLAETPYALFETFEIDEPEDAREERRQEMQATMRELQPGNRHEYKEGC